jgi:hypothetical protein
MIGYHIGICKRIHTVEIEKKEKEQPVNRRFGKLPEKQYIPVHDGREDKGKSPVVINVNTFASKLDGNVNKHLAEVEKSGAEIDNEEHPISPDFQGDGNEDNNLQQIQRWRMRFLWRATYLMG